MMTLIIAPETEIRLTAVAELKDSLAGLDRSVADVAAGRWMDPVEFDRRMAAKADALRAKRGAVAVQ